MKKLLLVALACAIAPSAFAASPWDGNWKLDVAKSHFEGSTFTYSKTASGMWHFSDGSNVNFDFAADGKPYKTIDADDTMTTTAKGNHELIEVNQFKGKTLSTIDETLSADGKTLTDHISGTKPNGEKFNDTTVMTRVGEGTGFLGKWKSTKVTVSAPGGYTIATAPDGTITWDIPDYKNTIKGKADGTPLPVSGPTAPPNMTLTLKPVGPRTFNYWVKISGKTLTIGKMTISADGKWLTDTSWAPGKESEKTIGVYMKS
jgi:hypothetical protein